MKIKPLPPLVGYLWSRISQRPSRLLSEMSFTPQEKAQIKDKERRISLSRWLQFKWRSGSSGYWSSLNQSMPGPGRHCLATNLFQGAAVGCQPPSSLKSMAMNMSVGCIHSVETRRTKSHATRLLSSSFIIFLVSLPGRACCCFCRGGERWNRQEYPSLRCLIGIFIGRGLSGAERPRLIESWPQRGRVIGCYLFWHPSLILSLFVVFLCPLSIFRLLRHRLLWIMDPMASKMSSSSSPPSALLSGRPKSHVNFAVRTV